VTLAVHTLRNCIYVCSFVGAGVLSTGVKQAMLYEDYLPSNHRAIASCCIVSACFFCSFLCWTNTIRYCSHLGFLIGSMAYTPPAITSSETTAALDVGVDRSTSTTNDHDNCQKPATKVGFAEDPDAPGRLATQLAKYLLMNFRYKKC
jgi:hypothetical protein